MNDAAQGESGTKRIETERRHAFQQFRTLQLEVEKYELKLGIAVTWTPDRPEWKSTTEYIKTRDYRLALDRVELLVVQRILELQKINQAGTGKRPLNLC